MYDLYDKIDYDLENELWNINILKDIFRNDKDDIDDFILECRNCFNNIYYEYDVDRAEYSIEKIFDYLNNYLYENKYNI